MGLNTENSSAVTGGANVNAGNTHEVLMLVGTRVQSLGRDVKAGEVVTISNSDYRFLKAYEYYVDADAVEVVEGTEAEDIADTDGEGTEDTDDAEVDAQDPGATVTVATAPRGNRRSR